jgi:hypothetical protein
VLQNTKAAQNIGRLSCVSMAGMNKRRKSWIAGIFVLLLGLMPLMNSLDNPRLASAHGVDFVRLIAVGICFGVGGCLVAASFRFPGE